MCKWLNEKAGDSHHMSERDMHQLIYENTTNTRCKGNEKAFKVATIVFIEPASSYQVHDSLGAVGLLIHGLARATERWGTALSDSIRIFHPRLMAIRIPTSTLGNY